MFVVLSPLLLSYSMPLEPSALLNCRICKTYYFPATILCLYYFLPTFLLELIHLKNKRYYSFLTWETFTNSFIHIRALSLMCNAFGLYTINFNYVDGLQSERPSGTFVKRKAQVQVEFWVYIWQEQRFNTFKCQLCYYFSRIVYK